MLHKLTNKTVWHFWMSQSRSQIIISTDHSPWQSFHTWTVHTKIHWQLDLPPTTSTHSYITLAISPPPQKKKLTTSNNPSPPPQLCNYVYAHRDWLVIQQVEVSNKVSDGRVIEEVLQHLLADLGGVLHIQAVQQVQCIALKTTQPALQQLAAADHLHTLCTHSTHYTLCTLYTLYS